MHVKCLECIKFATKFRISQLNVIKQINLSLKKICNRYYYRLIDQLISSLQQQKNQQHQTKHQIQQQHPPTLHKVMKKKIDSRIQTLIQNGTKSHQRSMLILVGDRARYQVVNLHYMLVKNSPNNLKPKVLWCYKNNLEFSSHQKKRMKQVKNMQMKGLYDEKIDDPFQLFISSTEIRYTYYKESHKILGNTYQMLILQDFEALTPNLLCRAIQTIEGGGLIVFLLKTMTSLKQLHSLVMDSHQRYRTQAFSQIEPRFNERFLLSLSKNMNCIVMDDELNILPISQHINSIEPIDPSTLVNKKVSQELDGLKKSLASKQVIGELLAKAKTLDQAKVIMTLVDVLNDKSSKTTVSLTAGRGRGKSAAIGLGIAAAIRLGFSNIFVTAPSPDNLKTLFEFICFGLQALDYKDRMDYEKIHSSSKDHDKPIIRIEVKKTHTQFIQYVYPTDADKIGHTDLVIIDQAAAIPLPYVKAFLGPHHVFMCSTINGYEGTGRSLSLKLIEEIRQKSYALQGKESSSGFKRFKELTMTDPIRYALNDEIERWLNDLLCLNATEPVPLKGDRLPHPSECQLYIVNKDTLFSYKSSSEKFLFSLMSLFISSHYKNSPNDLQLLSDSPSHLLFVLLGPLRKTQDGKAQMPDILCAIQLALEGNLSNSSITNNAQRGIKPSGDLIPWNIREQYQDNDFPRLAGGRVVRIATHAKAVKMGYGSRALSLLSDFFEKKLLSLDEDAEITNYDFRGQGVRKPLLKKLDQVRPPTLQYLGTSFGFTQQLLKFWRKNGFQPVYLRQTINDITAEHSGIMLKPLDNQNNRLNVEPYVSDFKRRFMTLLSFEFRKLNPSLALEILTETKKNYHTQANQTNQQGQQNSPSQKLLPKQVFQNFITLFDYNRLKSYCRNQIDYHLILDLLPTLTKLYYEGKLGDISLGYTNQVILVAMALQCKNVEELCSEVTELESRNVLALFQKTMIKFSKACQLIYQQQLTQKYTPPTTTHKPTAVANTPHSADSFSKQQTEKIFTTGTPNDKTKSKINYYINDGELEEVDEKKVLETGIVTVKRHLDQARNQEYNEPGSNGKKKVKKH